MRTRNSLCWGGTPKIICLSEFIALVHPVCRSYPAAQRPEARDPERRRRLHHEAAEERIRLPDWQAAIEVLMLCSRGGDLMLARIGVMRALNRGVERVFNPDRKDTHWGKRKFKRDQ